MNDTERVEAFLDALRHPKASANTIYTYRNVLDQLLRTCQPLASHDLVSLEHFLARPRTRRGSGKDVSAATVEVAEHTPPRQTDRWGRP